MSKATNHKLALGISIGAGIGLALGQVFFDNLAVAMCIGAGLGIVWVTAKTPNNQA